MPQRPPRFQPLHWRPKSEQIRQWAKFHPGENARQRSCDGQWEELRRLWLADPRCRLCAVEGRETAADTVDHIVPIWEAPDRWLDPSNIQSLCRSPARVDSMG
jgi:5-methylcytosine-specific restriction endonuclease McrA